MNNTLLLQNFHSALIWNGLYTVYKLFFLLRNIFLYRYLSTQDFSLWANGNSIIFLLLLWLDCGLRKSIPRYAPQMGARRNYWLMLIASLQITILILGLPVIYYALSYITTNNMLLALMSAIYISEGLLAIIHLAYHAYFYNKSFNLMAMIAASLEMGTIFIFAVKISESATLLLAVLTIKLCSTAGLIVASLWQFKHQTDPLILKQTLQNKVFMQHSGAMWGTMMLNSLTERNILIPIITYFMGKETANICKLAHDGALYCYRIITKTLGSSDTALLAHIEEGYNDETEKRKAMESAIEKLTTQIMRLILPLLGIIGVVMYGSYLLSYDQYVFHAFFIIAVGYLAETIWIPYRRLLEVQQLYRLLFISYIPYLLLLCILFYLLYISCIGLLCLLLLLHGVRLVTGFIMRMHVYRKFNI